MIKKITVQNFFSFGAEQTIELNADTNILVGINGTGKSNFIKAIRLLQEGIKGNFEKLFSHQWGGFSGCVNLIGQDATEIKISYFFDGSAMNMATKRAFGMSGDIDYHIRIVKTGLKTYKIFESVSTREMLDYQEGFNLNELVLSQMKLSFRQDPGLTFLRSAIEKITIYDNFDTSFGGEIRQLSPHYSENQLLSNGKNLTALLDYLDSNSIKVFEKIVDELKNVNPNFKQLTFPTVMTGKTLLCLKEKNLESPITIEHISDGTLRYLLLLSIFYNPNRGGIVCIDEPEAGLHPDMINGIAKGIKYAAQNGTQMIVATHSPLLLNAFELEDLMIFEKGKNNQTIVKTVSEEDFPDWEGEFLPGQMWLRGELGGVRW